MITRRHLLNLSLASAVLAASPLAWAGASAEDFVKAKQAELTKLVKQGKEAEVDKVFDQLLDYRVLAEAALGEHWAGRTDAEREEFTGLLARLVRASYRKSLKQTLGYDVAYKGVEKGVQGEVVRTIATSTKDARQEPLSIDYVVRSVGGGQRIVDVVTEGSSMVRNYRTSFNRIIKKSGFAELLKKMRKKADSGSTSPD